MHVTFQKVMSIFYVEWMHFSFQREIPSNAFIDIGITLNDKRGQDRRFIILLRFDGERNVVVLSYSLPSSPLLTWSPRD